MRLPWEGDGRRSPRPVLVFWLLTACATVVLLWWIHHQDAKHDHWDWSDWLEGSLASASGGFVAVGVVWVATAASIRRVRDRARRRSLRARLGKRAG